MLSLPMSAILEITYRVSVFGRWVTAVASILHLEKSISAQNVVNACVAEVENGSRCFYEVILKILE